MKREGDMLRRWKAEAQIGKYRDLEGLRANCSAAHASLRDTPVEGWEATPLMPSFCTHHAAAACFSQPRQLWLGAPPCTFSIKFEGKRRRWGGRQVLTSSPKVCGIRGRPSNRLLHHQEVPKRSASKRSRGSRSVAGGLCSFRFAEQSNFESSLAAVVHHWR